MTNSAEQLDLHASELSLEPQLHRSPQPAEDDLDPRPIFQGHAWAALVVLSILADLSMLPIITTLNGPPRLTFFVPFAAIGCALAQGSLLAVWLAWGDGPFSRRFMWHWVAAGVLCCVWLIGMTLSLPNGDDEFVDVGLTVALTVPLVSLGAQLPLWIVRQQFGWRLARPAGSGVAANDPPLAIRDLMAATVIVAVTLGLARLSPAAQKGPTFWIAWCIGLVIAASVSTVIMLPAAAMLLRPRGLRRALLNAGLFAGSAISFLWLHVVLLRWRWPQFLAPWQIYVCLSVLILAFAGTVILAALVIRGQGYHLAWGRDRGATGRGATGVLASADRRI
jgi:hypothetical protein